METDMRPGDFDHRRAWHELAKPAFGCLPANIRDLYELIRVDYDHLVQGPNLDVNWPEDPGLRRLFDNLDSEYLAQAAAVIYRYGHWSPEGGDGGAYWRFANLADQVLRQRLDLVKEGKGRLHFCVHEGALRLCHDIRDVWEWEDVCLVTPESLETCRGLVVDGDYDASLRAIKKAAPGPRFAHDMLDTRRFIVKTPAEVAIDDVFDGSDLGRHDIIDCNHRPHPFMITNRHLENSLGMYLDPDSAPCGMPGCDLSHAEHESDRVLVIAGFEDTAEQKAAIHLLPPVLEAHKIDGIVFLKED